MSDSIDNLQELTSDRDELFNSLASLKFDFNDLIVCKYSVEKRKLHSQEPSHIAKVFK